MTPLIEHQLEAFFRQHRPPTRVADIGAGADDRVAAALDRVEPAIEHHAGGAARLDRYDRPDVDICTTSLPKKYDTVVCCDLLEHVLDPFAAARNIVRAVRVPAGCDGGAQFGWLYVTTVFAFEHHDYPIDMWRFTTTALIHLFGELLPWAVYIERCWYEEETPLEGFGRRWRVSLVGQRPATGS